MKKCLVVWFEGQIMIKSIFEKINISHPFFCVYNGIIFFLHNIISLFILYIKVLR